MPNCGGRASMNPAKITARLWSVYRRRETQHAKSVKSYRAAADFALAPSQKI